jgi:hypothetical protein
MKRGVVAIAALLLTTSSRIDAQAAADSVILTRAIEAVLAHRVDLHQHRISVAVDERRAENVTRRSTMEAISRAMGNGRAVYRENFDAARNCGATCRSPFPEPLLVVSSIKDSGPERVVVMSLILPGALAGASEQAVLARGVRPESAGSLFLVTMRHGARGWEVAEVKEGTGDRAPCGAKGMDCRP